MKRMLRFSLFFFLHSVAIFFCIKQCKIHKGTECIGEGYLASNIATIIDTLAKFVDHHRL